MLVLAAASQENMEGERRGVGSAATAEARPSDLPGFRAHKGTRGDAGDG